MKERDGSELFGANDPRSQTTAIIEVDAEDDRQSVLTAILTQEKQGCQQTILILPEPNKAFGRKTDFEGLRLTQQQLRTRLVLIVPPASRLASYARRQRLPVYDSLEHYRAQTLVPQLAPPAERAASPTTAIASASPPARSESAQTGDERRSAPPQSAPSLTNGDQETQPLPPFQAGQPAVSSSPGPPVFPAAPASSHPRRTPRFKRMRVVLLLALIVIVLGSGLLLVMTGLNPLAILFGGPATSAVVTIVPTSQRLQNTYMLYAQPGLPANPQQHQVSARFLSSPAVTKTLQAAASGHGITPATQAHGLLTFYNALATPQTVPAGTLLTDEQGVQVITDETAVLPAATPPLEASMTVPAHAVVAGASGNIPATAFKTQPCCSLGITVQNAQPFSGGEDARPYSYVQQSDIDHAAATLQSTLMPQARQALEKLALSSERFAAAPRCSATTTADHQAGDAVATVNVTVTEVCTGEVYNELETRLTAASLLAAEAVQRLGADYSLTGGIATSLPVVAALDRTGLITLRAYAAGVWVYRLDEARQQALARLIEGKSLDEAQALLKRQPGIQSVSLSLAGGNGSTLPVDASRITIQVAVVPGLQGSPLPTPSVVTPTPTPSPSSHPVSPLGSAATGGALLSTSSHKGPRSSSLMQ
jgi:hypothetical protein